MANWDPTPESLRDAIASALRLSYDAETSTEPSEPEKVWVTLDGRSFLVSVEPMD